MQNVKLTTTATSTSTSSKPKSTLMKKSKTKPKKSGLASKKVTNVNFSQLEKDSQKVVEQQEREKAFTAAVTKDSQNNGSNNSSKIIGQTTINSKPVSIEHKKKQADRLGMGLGGLTGQNKSNLHDHQHGLFFQEIRQTGAGGQNTGISPSLNSILSSNNNDNHLNSSNNIHHKMGEELSVQMGVTSIRKGSIMEDSNDISDLLGRANLGNNDDDAECIEYDAHGLVTK